jgi:hypothetical protein
MDAKSLATLGLRLMAVYLIAAGITDLPIYLGAVYDAVAPHSSLSANWGFYLMGVLSPFVIGAALWFLAPSIGKRVMGKAGDTTVSGSVDASNLQTAAFSVLGVYFVIQSLPILIFLIVDALGFAPGSNIPLANGQSIWSTDHFYGALLRTVFGTALVLGSGFFTRLFRRFREFGLSSSSSN